MADFDDVYKKTNSYERISLGDGQAEGVLTLSKDIDLDGRGVRFTPIVGVSMNGGTGEVKIGEPQGGITGKLDMYSIQLDGSSATISAGGNSGRGEGKMVLYNRYGKETVKLEGRHGNLTLGGERSDGDIALHNSSGVRTMRMNGDGGHLICGDEGQNGRIDVKNTSGVNTITMWGEHGNMVLGAEGADGDLTLKSSNGEDAIVMNGSGAEIIVGGVGTNGDIIMRNNLNEDTIHITGSDGDIRFLNADFAEEFTIQADAIAVTPPGTVMALDAAGLLVPSAEDYNTRVVGVIAGAGQYKPAIVLDNQGGNDRKAVAMVGKAMVQVSAHNGAVKVGDLLTSSNVPGVAMKVTDRALALGAVIGKALAPHEDGTALVPVLVNLQ